MMIKQTLPKLLIAGLAFVSMHCEADQNESFPSQLIMNINQRNMTFEKEYLAAHQTLTYEKDQSLNISASHIKDSLIFHRFSFNIRLKNATRITLDSAIKFSDLGGEFYVTAVEKDDDAIIGWYLADVNESSFVLTEMDTLNRIASGRFEGVFHVEESYKSGPLARFRQLPDSFEVRDGFFRVQYKQIRN